MKLRSLKFWAPSILWMALIFICSTDLFSAKSTGVIVGKAVGVLAPESPKSLVEYSNLFVRKSGHILGFAILTFLYLVGMKSDFKVWNSLTCWESLVAFLGAVSYACLDEWHQSFSHVREASVLDVGWDSIGAILILCVLHVYQYSSVCKLPETRP